MRTTQDFPLHLPHKASAICRPQLWNSSKKFPVGFLPLTSKWYYLDPKIRILPRRTGIEDDDELKKHITGIQLEIRS